MAAYTKAVNEIKGMWGSFAKSNIAQRASRMSSSIANDATDVSRHLSSRAKDAASATTWNLGSGLKYAGVGAGIGAGVGAGNAYMNNEDMGRGAFGGAVKGTMAGGLAYGLNQTVSGIRASGRMERPAMFATRARKAKDAAVSSMMGNVTRKPQLALPAPSLATIYPQNVDTMSQFVGPSGPNSFLRGRIR